MADPDWTAKFFAAVRAHDLQAVATLLAQDSSLVSAHCPGDTRLLGVTWTRKTSHDPVAPGDPRSCTALHHAAHNGLPDLARLLLARGADPNAIGYDNNRNDVTPLVLAAAEGNVPTLEVLLDHGADPNFASARGVTPLNTAIEEKSIEKARLLISRGATPDLHAASRLGLVQRVAQLLNVNPSYATHPDRTGQTPLDAAVEWGRREIADLLLQHGAPLAPRVAAGFGMLAELRAFLDNDPELLHTANLLTLAAINGAVASLELLLARGADPNEFDADRAQPLHNVAMSMVRPACADSVMPLLKAGADPSHVHRGYTPMQRARAGGNQHVVEAFLAQGIRS